MMTNREYFHRAQNVLPLGVADNFRHWSGDDMLCIRSARGPFVTDISGSQYVDFRLGYGPIILGYRDERVDAAVFSAIRDNGAILGFSTELELLVATAICDFIPGIEKVRFCNSGTEAVISAIRTARGFTGRSRIVLMDGCFHGLADELMWRPMYETTTSSPQSLRSLGVGVPRETSTNITFLKMNDIESAENLFSSMGDDIAAVIIEPILANSGCVPASQEFLSALRQLCDQRGSLLIFDEIKTCFRVEGGSAQAFYGVRPDITTLAKAIGNGYPIAAFGGRRSIMDCISTRPNGVVHGGTYCAHITGLAAALATMSELTKSALFDGIQSTGRRVKTAIAQGIALADAACEFQGTDLMFCIRIQRRCGGAPIAYNRFAHSLLREGILVEPEPSEPWFICQAHETIDLNSLTMAVRNATIEACTS